MKDLLLNVANGFIIAAVADYSVFADWQAWALILWFVFAMSVVANEARREALFRYRYRGLR